MTKKISEKCTAVGLPVEAMDLSLCRMGMQIVLGIQSAESSDSYA